MFNVMVIGDITPFAITKLKEIKNINLNISISKIIDFEFSRDTHILITRYANKITDDFLKSFPSLKLIVQASTGTDNIDFKVLKKLNIEFLVAEGESTISVAEQTIMFALSLKKNHIDISNQMKNNIWTKKEYQGREFYGTNFGIIGLGRIGKRVSLLANQFGANVYAFDPYIDSTDFKNVSATHCNSLNELFSNSEMISLHVPLTTETYQMISKTQLLNMQKGAYFINTSRGGIVDESSLYELLQENHLSGAAIDVFENEPYNGVLCRLTNVICSPHIAGVTVDALERISLKTIDLMNTWIQDKG